MIALPNREIYDGFETYYTSSIIICMRIGHAFKRYLKLKSNIFVLLKLIAFYGNMLIIYPDSIYYTKLLEFQSQIYTAAKTQKLKHFTRYVQVKMKIIYLDKNFMSFGQRIKCQLSRNDYILD